MKKFINLSLIALFFTVIFVGCQVFTTSFTPQEDSGIQVSKITLSETSVTLSGSRNVANRTVTATVSPSFAQDATVYWESLDENICGLSATTGSSVTLILKGEGKATVTAKDYSGKVSSTINVNCLFETTPPFAVSSVSATPHANNVFFTWTDPVDYDSDLDHIEIVASNGEKTSVAAGTQYGWVKNLSAGTEYTFTLTAYDLNNNPSSAVSATATTLESADTTVPVAQTAFAASANNGTSATFTWTLGTGTYQKLAVKAADSSALSLSAATSSNSRLSFAEDASSVVFDIPDNTTNSVTISGFETGKSYVLSLCELNADLVSSDASVELSFLAAPTVSNNDVNYITGGLAVVWTDFDNSEYKYKVTLNSETKEVAAGVQRAEFTGLTVDTSYDYSIYTLSSTGEILATVTGSGTPRKIWKIYNTYSSGTSQFVPNYTNSYNYGNVVTPTSVSDFKYDRWVVFPSLSNPSDTTQFSLMATDASGTNTGYYLCVDTVPSFPSNYNSGMGGYSGSSHPNHVWALSKDTIVNDMGSLAYASFKHISSSVTSTKQDGASAWYVWQVASDVTTMYLYDTYLCVSGETSYTASSGDYVFCYIEQK